MSMVVESYLLSGSDFPYYDWGTAEVINGAGIFGLRSCILGKVHSGEG